MAGALRGVLSRALTAVWPNRPHRWSDLPEALKPTLITTARLTIAAVIAFALTTVLSNGSVDLTGPLTALLVLQASAYSTLKMGLVRVGAVLGGVLIASLLSTWIGLTWWSLGAAIAAALLVAKVFRLGDQALETPISAMLILAVTTPGVAAETRILNTLIGTGVGMAFGLLFPTAMQTPAARRAVVKAAEAVAAPLLRAAEALIAGPPDRDQADGWLDASRSAARAVADADARLTLLKDARRLNPRALGTTDVEPVLRTALDTLERCQLAVRALCIALRAETPDPGRDGTHGTDPYGEELRLAFAVVLTDAGDCLVAFGNLAVAESEGGEQRTEALGTSLEILRETRAILTELVLTDATGNSAAWLLRGSVVTALGHLLTELDLEQHVRAHRSWQEGEDRRLAVLTGQLPPVLRGVLPHPERPLPRAVDTALEQLRRPRPNRPYESRWPEEPGSADSGSS